MRDGFRNWFSVFAIGASLGLVVTVGPGCDSIPSDDDLEASAGLAASASAEADEDPGAGDAADSTLAFQAAADVPRIGLRRGGPKNNPFYSIVVTLGTATEAFVGNYQPSRGAANFSPGVMRQWLARGARMTDTVARLWREYLRNNPRA